jgi:hypothetical protein
MGNDDYDDDDGDDGDGTERHTNQIEAMAVASGNNNHQRSILMELRGWTYLSTRLHFVNVYWLALPVQAIRGL